MIQGLKTVIWCCFNYRQQRTGTDTAAAAATAAAGGIVPSSVSQTARVPMTTGERQYTAKFFKWALPCLRIFTKTGGGANDWKEALDAFAGAFTVLGPYDLRTTVRRGATTVSVFSVSRDRGGCGMDWIPTPRWGACDRIGANRSIER